MNLVFILVTVAMTVPGLYMRWWQIHASPLTEAWIFGFGILGAAFLLSWAAEVAQVDISRGLALAILALIAILPEYAVDLYFAWVAAYKPEFAHYATANMTGANRLLVGTGWSFIVLLSFLKFRKKRVELSPTNRVEIGYLLVATLYAFTIPLRHSLNLIDCAVLVSLFAAYAWRNAIMEVHEPELVGPAHLISRLPRLRRRAVTALLFLFAGLAIFSCAEPFAESLVASGKLLGIDEFILVQWLAPIASEAPEFIIAAIWTLRGQAVAALGALISSKVNQWTLLVGTIPLVYSISLGEIGAMPFDLRQAHEILLTAAQSLFATAILMNLSINLWEAAALFLLFAIQLVFPDIRIEVTIIYLVLSVPILVAHRRALLPLATEGLLRGSKSP